MEHPALPAAAIRASARHASLAEDYLDGRIDEESLAAQGGWQIATVGDAAWAIARYREAQTLAAGIRMQAKEWRSDVDTWERASLEPLNRTLDFMGQRLQRYALSIREESEDRTKTISLPGGRIETRKPTRPKLVVDDETVLLDWCRENQPDAVKATYEAKVSLLRCDIRRDEGAEWGKLIDPETGEVIPGVHAEWSDTTAEVKV